MRKIFILKGKKRKGLSLRKTQNFTITFLHARLVTKLFQRETFWIVTNIKSMERSSWVESWIVKIVEKSSWPKIIFQNIEDFTTKSIRVWCAKVVIKYYHQLMECDNIWKIFTIGSRTTLVVCVALSFLQKINWKNTRARFIRRLWKSVDCVSGQWSTRIIMSLLITRIFQMLGRNTRSWRKQQVEGKRKLWH